MPRICASAKDYDLVVRLLARGARLRIEPRALYRYRKHGGSISHRLSPERIDAMLAAQARFRREAGPFDAAVESALEARRQSLETARIYEGVVAGLKSGAVASSLAAGLAHPRAWPLLAVPLRRRLKTLVGAA
jgi:succinoglycan biosynthesis protein ExoO